jgi:methylthioribose-1-phosphate isomerase
MTDDLFSPLRYQSGVLWLLDQTRLPREEVWLECRTVEAVASAIERLAVRGAPAIGVAAAFGVAVALASASEEPGAVVCAAIERLSRTRPTAVNLHRALERCRWVVEQTRGASLSQLRALVEKAANELYEFELEACRRMSQLGAELLKPGSKVLIHCNTGALATVGMGTALGVILEGFRQGRVQHVWVDETRPLWQGVRLTAWELQRAGVPHAVVVDGMAAALMKRGEVDAVLVGADRIAANGDTANKIGTYGLAVLARHHGIPFYVVAPTTTIDPGVVSGEAIPIEERAAEEVLRPMGLPIAPPESSARNWAFDVTPGELLTALVTEAGVFRPPLNLEPLSRRRAETSAAGSS